MQSVKETAANIAASAKSGMEKTKAVVQEKVEKMTANDPVEIERAEERKEVRIKEAELNKQEAYLQNAAARRAEEAGGIGNYTATGTSPRKPQSPTSPQIAGIGTGARTAAPQSPTNASRATTATGTAPPAGNITEEASKPRPDDPTIAVTGSQYPTGANTGSGGTPVLQTHVAGQNNPGTDAGNGTGMVRIPVSGPEAGGETNIGQAQAQS